MRVKTSVDPFKAFKTIRSNEMPDYKQLVRSLKNLTLKKL